VTSANDLSYLKEMEGRIKKGWLAGEFSVNEVTAGLVALRLEPGRYPRPPATVGAGAHLATARGQQWTDTHMGSEGDALPGGGRARLTNLGWTNPDIALMLSQAEGTLKGC